MSNARVHDVTIDGAALDRIPSVGSVMTPFPRFVDVEDSLLVARTMMVDHNVRHLPVKDGDQLVGIITDRDLKRSLDPDLGLPPKDQLFVRDVFVSDAFVVDSTEPLDTVLEQLTARHIGSAVVTRKGRLVGIFTLVDASRILCAHLRAMFPDRRGNKLA